MILKAEPFYTYEPLTQYLNDLITVVDEPGNAAHVEALRQSDKVLTDKAVLTSQAEFISGEGYRPVGMKPCTVSDGVTWLAGLVGREDSSSGRPITSHDVLCSARSALVTLGGRMAVSGAFIPEHMEGAYDKLIDGVLALALHEETIPVAVRVFDTDQRAISGQLFREYVSLHTRSRYEYVISKDARRRSIEAAWEVLGKPYGRLTKLRASVSKVDS
ncbi:MAG: hypothetical protein JWN38_364 [Candidatus Saccharibacteria bacterium]|nr:hypothetical protein [Candidatus Saccharibacteria bacterium]